MLESICDIERARAKETLAKYNHVFFKMHRLVLSDNYTCVNIDRDGTKQPIDNITAFIMKQILQSCAIVAMVQAIKKHILATKEAEQSNAIRFGIDTNNKREKEKRISTLEGMLCDMEKFALNIRDNIQSDAKRFFLDEFLQLFKGYDNFTEMVIAKHVVFDPLDVFFICFDLPDGMIQYVKTSEISFGMQLKSWWIVWHNYVKAETWLRGDGDDAMISARKHYGITGINNIILYNKNKNVHTCSLPVYINSATDVYEYTMMDSIEKWIFERYDILLNFFKLF